jgi:CheY-like chemotaxis protein
MLFRREPPDVVVTDVVMPEDSIELVMGLRQQNPKVPFIVVSGLAKHSAKAVEAATALRPRRTLAKPFGLPDLLGAADEVLSELNLDPSPKKKR